MLQQEMRKILFKILMEDFDMKSLISSTMGSLHQCSAEEYVNGDTSLSVCVDMADEEWDKNFLDSLTEEAEPMTGDGEEEEEDFNAPPPVPKLKSFKEAIQSMEDVKIFLEHHGYFEQASTASSLLAEMATSHSSTLVQSTLDHYFKQSH